MKKFTFVFLSNLSIVMSLVLLTLFVTDRFNHAMGFMSSQITLWIIFAFCIVVIVHGALCIWLWLKGEQRRKERASDRENRRD